jgi:hypothetical protein
MNSGIGKALVPAQQSVGTEFQAAVEARALALALAQVQVRALAQAQAQVQVQVQVQVREWAQELDRVQELAPELVRALESALAQVLGAEALVLAWASVRGLARARREARFQPLARVLVQAAALRKTQSEPERPRVHRVLNLER